MKTGSDVIANSLSLAFGNETVIENVSLSIDSGSFVSLLGPSGCGKTSLLRLVAGLQTPTAGKVDVRCVAGTRRPRIGYVFQDPTLMRWRNVVDNIRLPLELRGEANSASRTVDQVLSMVGLKPQDKRKFPHMLSGGMRMRVSLARALVDNPDILLLDEPFAALDDLLRQRLNEELLALWHAAGWTALFVTHNVAEAIFLSQTIIVMSKCPGRILHQLTIPFAYPRESALRSQPEFARLTGEVSAMMRGDI